MSGWSRFIVSPGSRCVSTDRGELRLVGLFTSTEAGCSGCHSGPDLSDHTFRNIGNIGGPYRWIPAVSASFPSRRSRQVHGAHLGNVALTAPYMHDGSIATLEAAVDHFISGGVDDPNKDPASIHCSSRRSSVRTCSPSCARAHGCEPSLTRCHDEPYAILLLCRYWLGWRACKKDEADDTTPTTPTHSGTPYPCASRQSAADGDPRREPDDGGGRNARSLPVLCEEKLSATNIASCATCHRQAYAFQDSANAVSTGIDGIAGNNAVPWRHQPWLCALYFWDGRAATLEDQIYGPVRNPIEMHDTWPNVVSKPEHTGVPAAVQRRRQQRRFGEGVEGHRAVPPHPSAAIAKYDVKRGEDAFTPDEAAD